jgi:hypothetical protein
MRFVEPTLVLGCSSGCDTCVLNVERANDGLRIAQRLMQVFRGCGSAF